MQQSGQMGAILRESSEAPLQLGEVVKDAVAGYVPLADLGPESELFLKNRRDNVRITGQNHKGIPNASLRRQGSSMFCGSAR